MPAMLLGAPNALISPHAMYLQLGNSDNERQSHYRGLFDSHIDARDLDDIRHASNKPWVLGTDRLKEQVEALTNRQTRPKPRMVTGNQSHIVRTRQASKTDCFELIFSA